MAGAFGLFTRVFGKGAFSASPPVSVVPPASLRRAASQRLSPSGRAALRRLEGVVAHAYKDSGGRLTIGVGHLLSSGELQRGTVNIAGTLVSWRGELTSDQVDQLLGQDAAWAERDVAEHVDVALTQQQFDALVIFVFNVGPTAFGKSTLLRQLNAGKYASIPAQLARWVYDDGKKSKGLVYRRAQEAAIWRSA